MNPLINYHVKGYAPVVIPVSFFLSVYIAYFV